VRICYDGRGIGREPTGAAKAVSLLVRQLRRDFAGHDYRMLTPRADRPWRLPRQLLWEQVELPARARRHGAEVLHAATGTSAPLWHPVKVVMTLHDLAPTRHPEWLSGWRSRWYWGRWVPRTARSADRIVVPSESTRRDVLALLGVPAARVHVVPLALALDPTVTPLSPEDVRALHRLPDRYLLYVGTIDRRKDYRTLLDALARLPADVGLVVAGTVIAGRTDFRETIQRLGLAPRVRVLGYVPDAHLPALYRAAAVFVYPSFYEGFGLPVLEAMACGTPVVTYNTTSLPEVAADAAVLLDLPVTGPALADALRGLLEDSVRRRDLVERGRGRAAEFGWQRTAALTAAVYESLSRP
jgi:glycosyltransferase involved in cell wall biosynthesis